MDTAPRHPGPSGTKPLACGTGSGALGSGSGVAFGFAGTASGLALDVVGSAADNSAGPCAPATAQNSVAIRKLSRTTEINFGKDFMTLLGIANCFGVSRHSHCRQLLRNWQK